MKNTFFALLFLSLNAFTEEKSILYVKEKCPYCVKVKEKIKETTSSSIEIRDISSLKNRQELLQIGGKIQVPCLVTILYESQAIIEKINKENKPE